MEAQPILAGTTTAEDPVAQAKDRLGTLVRESRTELRVREALRWSEREFTVAARIEVAKEALRFLETDDTADPAAKAEALTQMLREARSAHGKQPPSPTPSVARRFSDRAKTEAYTTVLSILGGRVRR